MTQEEKELLASLKEKERKSKFKEIVAATRGANISIDLDASEPKFADAFNQIWPVLKPILEYAELVRITGPEVDKVIRAVIDVGVRISTGNAGPNEQTEFISKLDNIWNPIKTVLGIVVSIANSKVDKVINNVIEIGDWITQE